MKDATVGMLLVIIPLGCISLAYSLPVLPLKNKKRLRDWGWLKILSLAGVWTISTSVLPVFYWHKELLAYPFEIAMRFFFIFAICIIFDIRDIRADTENNIHTLPHVIGLQNSYLVINISLMAFVVLCFLQCLHYHNWDKIWAVFITAIATRIAAYYLGKHPSVRGYFLIADGVMMIYAMLVLLV